MGKSKKPEKRRKNRLFYRFSIYKTSPLRVKIHRPNFRHGLHRSRKHGENRFLGMDIFRSMYNLAQSSPIIAESFTFRLHGNVTAIILVTFSIIITTRQYVGNPIDCIHTKDIPEDVLNTFCWIHSTFTVIQDRKHLFNYDDHLYGIQYAGNHLRKQVKYYQWVAFVLFFQAILFYIPRQLWKSWEGGKIGALVMDLNIAVCSDTEKLRKKQLIVDYLWNNLRYNNLWAYKYQLCEYLAFLNVVGQMFLMDRFFDGAFLTFGFDIIKFINSDEEERKDPIIEIFPRMTKCTFRKYGVSGDQEKHDALCILPLNVVNEKIYIFLWFWFFILTILTGFTIIYRITIMFSPRTRVYMLRLRYRLVRKRVIETIVCKSKMGDWFLLYMLGQNLDTLVFRDVLNELSQRLSRNHFHYNKGNNRDQEIPC